MDLVCIGTPAVDYLHTENGVLIKYGGSQTTTACTVAKLGLKVGLLGYIGTDEMGQNLIKDIEKHGRRRAEGWGKD